MMDPRHTPAVDDVRTLMQSLGVARSATAFACPTCSARSFAVLPSYPMTVECLACGTLAPFSVATGDAESADEPAAWAHEAGRRTTIDRRAA